MSRQRFPSDHRGWFRVTEDILDEPKFFGEDWKLAAYIRVLAALNRAKSQDGSIRVSRHSLKALMGRDRIDLAEKRLRLLVHVGLTCAARYADFWLLLVPKWPVIQGFATAPLRENVGTKTKTKTKTKERNSANAPTSPILIDLAWNKGVDAALQYGTSAKRWKPTDTFRRNLRALQRDRPELGSEVFAIVVHGYRYARRDWSEVEKHFHPKTMLRPANREEYVVAYLEAIELGNTPPFQAQTVADLTARANQEKQVKIDRQIAERKRYRNEVQT